MLFFSMMFFFLVFFLWCSCSCFPTCQNRSSCGPPFTWCSFNYELGECKHVKICWFVQCLAIITCLVAHCAFVVNMRFTPWYPNRCAHHPIWNFVEATSYIFIVIIIQVASNWAFTCQLATSCVTTTSVAFLVLFSSLSFHFTFLCSSNVVLSIAFLCKIPKYLVIVTTCNLK
jgi:hypothetical protein